MKNVQNFLHLYDNNRLIIIGLNEMLPGHHNRVFRSFLLRKFMWTTLEIVLKFQPKVFLYPIYLRVWYKKLWAIHFWTWLARKDNNDVVAPSFKGRTFLYKTNVVQFCKTSLSLLLYGFIDPVILIIDEFLWKKRATITKYITRHVLNASCLFLNL